MPDCSPILKLPNPRKLAPDASLRGSGGTPTGVLDGDVVGEMKGVSVDVCDGDDPLESVGVIDGDGVAVNVCVLVFDGDAPEESVAVGV